MFSLRVSDPARQFAALLDALPLRQDLHARIRAQHAAPARLYHGTYHLAQMWLLHCRLSSLLGQGQTRLREIATAEARRRIACAIAFHDFNYDPRRTRDVNKVESAASWVLLSSVAGTVTAQLTLCDRYWVRDAILATADHPLARCAMADDLLCAWLVDLDLAALAETPAQFDFNTRLLRIEYGHLSDVDWADCRRRALLSLLARQQLFKIPEIAALLEEPARSNLFCALHQTK